MLRISDDADGESDRSGNRSVRDGRADDDTRFSADVFPPASCPGQVVVTSQPPERSEISRRESVQVASAEAGAVSAAVSVGVVIVSIARHCHDGQAWPKPLFLTVGQPSPMISRMAQGRSIKRFKTALGMVVLAFAARGCASTIPLSPTQATIHLYDDYGGSTQAYLIPASVFAADPEIASNPSRLAPYSVGVTPVTRNVLAGIGVYYVAVRDDGDVSRPVPIVPSHEAYNFCQADFIFSENGDRPRDPLRPRKPFPPPSYPDGLRPPKPFPPPQYQTTEPTNP
jgi:hypothetical protein